MTPSEATALVAELLETIEALWKASSRHDFELLAESLLSSTSVAQRSGAQREVEHATELLGRARLSPEVVVGLLMSLRQRLGNEVVPELVWTGPTSEAFRTTRQVLSEMIRRSTNSLMIVGYLVTPSSRGADNSLAHELMEAAQRGVRTTIVLDELNAAPRALRLGEWPRPARVLTWERNDKHQRLHAKVVVQDEARALITSANLTYYGLEKNMELGVLVGPGLTAALAKHMAHLERLGHLREVRRGQGTLGENAPR